MGLGGGGGEPSNRSGRCPVPSATPSQCLTEFGLRVQVKRDAVANRVALNAAAREREAAWGLADEEALGRRALELTEKDAIERLSVEQRRVALEESRRVVQRRREGGYGEGAAEVPTAALRRSSRCSGIAEGLGGSLHKAGSLLLA